MGEEFPPESYIQYSQYFYKYQYIERTMKGLFIKHQCVLYTPQTTEIEIRIRQSA